MQTIPTVTQLPWPFTPSQTLSSEKVVSFYNQTLQWGTMINCEGPLPSTSR